MTGDEKASNASAEASRTVSPIGRWSAAAFFAVAISASRELTLPASALVIAAGLGISLMAKNAPPASRSDSTAVTRASIAVWATVLAMFCLWELAAFLIGNNDAHPTFSMLTDPLLAWSPTRALAGLGWLACGSYLLTR